ncbi:uncharacterized protein LOC108107727 [Drosophila eugracilis]|uniref:uncharacterized protein LOC108107727 n=1 Tax=Drosophila eugracilis TaxID=29029 RepID=UPI0007E5CDD3|nr:uncharacterized protein LOC108107727 [Drosophila eugracilis]
MPDNRVMENDKRKNHSHASLLLNLSSTHVQHVESPVSVRRSNHSIHNQSGAKTKDHDHDQNSSLLSNDFVLMLDCSPTLEEVFCERSPEYRIAWLWFNKLTTMSCNTLYDLRLRNAYMSHFIVCLNQRRLTGIFENPPPSELIWVNFSENQPKANEMTQRPCDTNQSLPAAPVSPSSCSCSGRRSTEYSDFLGNSHRPSGGTITSTPKSPLSKRRQLLRSVPMTSDEELQQLFQNKKADFNLNRPTSHVHLATCRSQSSPAKFLGSKKRPNAFRSAGKSPEEAKKRMVKLLELIRKDLRGEPDLENKDVLEGELKSYRKFFKKNLQDNSDFEPHPAGSPNSERVHMLLNMQTDLIRLMKEDFPNL